MNTEDKAKLERLHQSTKTNRRSFSSLEFDEFIVDATNEGKDTNEILEEVHNRFDLKLTGVQLRARLLNLRNRYGISVAYKYNVKNGKRVSGIVGKVAARRRGRGRTRKQQGCGAQGRAQGRTQPRPPSPPESHISNFARVGALLRYNGNSKELIDKYISEVVREAVLVDLKRLGV